MPSSRPRSRSSSRSAEISPCDSGELVTPSFPTENMSLEKVPVSERVKVCASGSTVPEVPSTSSVTALGFFTMVGVL